MRTRLAILGLCATLPLAIPLTSHAQSPKAKKALELLETGKQLLEKGKPAEACKALEESVAIEQAINTHYQLGRCYEAQSRFATAHAAYLRAATMARTAGDNQRFEAAQAASDELKAKIASLVVVVASENEIPGLKVTRDGEALAREDWGKAVAVDQGEHEIKVEAPGYEPWSETVNAERSAGATTVAVPKLKPVSAPLEPVPVTEPEVDDSGYERRSSGLFGLGIALTCLGGVSVLGGAIGAVAVGANPNAQVGPGAFVGVGLLGLAMLGAGIPITVVFGAKVPPESPSGDQGESSESPDAEPSAPPEETGFRLTPLLGPTGGGLRLDF